MPGELELHVIIGAGGLATLAGLVALWLRSRSRTAAAERENVAGESRVLGGGRRRQSVGRSNTARGRERGPIDTEE